MKRMVLAVLIASAMFPITVLADDITLVDDERKKVVLHDIETTVDYKGRPAIALDMTPQALSYHLSKLKKADLIYETRYKNYIYYELNLSILDETIMWISNLRGGQQ